MMLITMQISATRFPKPNVICRSLVESGLYEGWRYGAGHHSLNERAAGRFHRRGDQERKDCAVSDAVLKFR